MPRHLAFARAINLGSRRKVPMADLRDRLAAAGFSDVETYLQTGNIALTTPMRSGERVESVLEDFFEDAYGFEVPTIVRRPDAVASLVAEIESHPPLLDAGAKRYVALTKTEVTDSAAGELAAYDASPERCRVIGEDILLEVSADFAAATLSRQLERRAGTALTVRTLAVMQTVSEKWSRS